jgi:hypothetical protein
MCVTRPQTQEGVVEEFAKDLAEGVEYAKNPKTDQAATGAIYGGLPKGVPAIREAVRTRMVEMLDTFQGVPPE